MSRRRLEASLRSLGIAYILFFIAWAHYAYLGKWGKQILFWITLGGLGIWWLFDLFRIPGLIERYNAPILDDIDYLEYRDREIERERDDFAELRKMKAVRSGNLLEDRRRRF